MSISLSLSPLSVPSSFGMFGSSILRHSVHDVYKSISRYRSEKSLSTRSAKLTRLVPLGILKRFCVFLDTDNGYMAFGLSGNEKESKMIGADVMVAFMDNGMVKLEDYTINQYSLVSGMALVSLHW